MNNFGQVQDKKVHFRKTDMRNNDIDTWLIQDNEMESDNQHRPFDNKIIDNKYGYGYVFLTFFAIFL